MVVLYHRLIKNATGLDNNFFIRRVFPSLDCGGIPSTISALRKKLPGFHRLSARRFGTQRSSFLPSSIRPVYGCVRTLQDVWHENPDSVTKSGFAAVPWLDRRDIILTVI